MKKFILQAIGLLILIIGGLFITRNPNLQINFFDIFSGPKYQTVGIKIKDADLKVLIADTDAKKAKGLSGRLSLASNSGMLFIYNEEEIRRFWMKNMKFPIDIIWIRKDKVVDILINALPPKSGTLDSELSIYQSGEPVDKVLEVNSGFINKHGIAIGDRIITQ